MTPGWEDEAKAEFKAAAYYYEEQADGLGKRFTAHIEATLTGFLPIHCFRVALIAGSAG